jgi:hypothetical protein
LNIKVKPAANLSKLEEVLVITKNEEKQPSLSSAEDAAPVRAVDVLAQRLPSVPDKPKVDPVTGKPVDLNSSAKPDDSAKLSNRTTDQTPTVSVRSNSQSSTPINKTPSTTGSNPPGAGVANKNGNGLGQSSEASAKPNSTPPPSNGTGNPPSAAIKQTHSVPKPAKPPAEPPVTGDTIPAQDVPQ